jgi:hypothetical protein
MLKNGGSGRNKPARIFKNNKNLKQFNAGRKKLRAACSHPLPLSFGGKLKPVKLFYLFIF